MIGLLFYRYLAWETKIYGLSMKKLIEKLSEIKIAAVQEEAIKLALKNPDLI
jgi:transposase